MRVCVCAAESHSLNETLTQTLTLESVSLLALASPSCVMEFDLLNSSDFGQVKKFVWNLTSFFPFICLSSLAFDLLTSEDPKRMKFLRIWQK